MTPGVSDEHAVQFPNPITKQEARLALHLPGLLLLSWCLPQRAWPTVARGFAGLPAWLLPLAPPTEPDLRPVPRSPRERVAGRIERQFEVLRELRPGGWITPIATEGFGQVHDAVASGRGAILWVATTQAASLVTKKAFAQENLAVHHLSRPEHGGHYSSFGRHFLNGINRMAEGKSLASRISVTEGTERIATRQMFDILSAGGVVSITSHRKGSQVRVASIFGVPTPLASGAPSLAHATGAPLVPVFCYRTGTDPAGRAQFRVIAAPAIPVDPDRPRRREVEAAVDAFAALHETVLAGHEDQWSRGSGSRPTDALATRT